MNDTALEETETSAVKVNHPIIEMFKWHLKDAAHMSPFEL